MEIHFIGTGSPYPDPKRGSSAILVDLGSARILLDCGRGCLQRMAEMGIAPHTITHCILTHGHYDHVADYALLVLTSWRFGRHHTLQVYGPPGTRAMSDALFNEVYKIDIAARKSLHSAEAAADIDIQVQDIKHGHQIEADGWRVRATEVKHWPIPISLGLLVEGDGRRIFFTGDTAPCDAVRQDAAGVDLLIHEAMYFSKESGHYQSHTHPTHAGEVARQAGVKQLILTHLQPKSTEEQLLNDATTNFSKTISMATDRMRIVV